ncbi:hypothetical protein SAMN04487967_3629 [Natronorubrum sediminis]|uniref:Uncharacterized protein n=1 Tax=Natronorubrum sediminis TaxID=640943 RepID=A0A1H6G6Z5_9EURY|nr:hypothetical protein SAMN04487967_3629 [Natronorubrum sediminis]
MIANSYLFEILAAGLDVQITGLHSTLQQVADRHRSYRDGISESAIKTEAANESSRLRTLLAACSMLMVERLRFFANLPHNQIMCFHATESMLNTM